MPRYRHRRPRKVLQAPFRPKRPWEPLTPAATPAKRPRLSPWEITGLTATGLAFGGIVGHSVRQLAFGETVSAQPLDASTQAFFDGLQAENEANTFAPTGYQALPSEGGFSDIVASYGADASVFAEEAAAGALGAEAAVTSSAAAASEIIPLAVLALTHLGIPE